MDNVQRLMWVWVGAVLAASTAHAQAGDFQQALLAQQQQQAEAQRRQADEQRQRAEQQRERDRSDRDYERGARALDAGQWDKALESFSAAPKDGGRGDAALYWKAYALNKLGRRNEALAALADLEKSFPNSRWINDAKALEIEVRQASGQPARPESEADDELKLMAINSLLTSDPERAVPLLEKVLQGPNPPKVKERALFVLVQSGSPRARTLLTEIAKGKFNPDLQLKALQLLGQMGGAESRQTLADIYGASGDAQVKRQILRSFMIAGDRDRLVAAARQEKSPGLRRDAIQQLGIMRGIPQLMDLYRAEPAAEAKKAILEALFIGGGAKEVGELARSEKDPQVRLEAIQKLGLMGKRTSADLTALYASEKDKRIRQAVIQAWFLQGDDDALIEAARKETDSELKREAIHRLGLRGKQTGDALVSLYAGADKPVRKEILQALFLQSNVKALIDIARKESDPELKKEAVHRLSLMRSKEAADFMMEILNK